MSKTATQSPIVEIIDAPPAEPAPIVPVKKALTDAQRKALDAHSFKPGRSGNPAGRPAAGTAIREWCNILIDDETPQAELLTIRDDAAAPPAKRAAAGRILRMLEQPDIADFSDFINGKATLNQLRARGVDTSVIKKAKARKTKYKNKAGQPVEYFVGEIELRDKSGEEFDRVANQTAGTPIQRKENLNPGPICAIIGIDIDLV